MLLVVLGIVSVLLLVVGAIWFSRSSSNEPAGQFLMALIGGVGIIVITAIGLCTSVGNLGGAADLEAFYHANAENYAITVDETSEVLTVSLERFQALIPIEGSIEKLDVGQAVAARIAEWRDKVNSYNRNVERFRAYDQSTWAGILYPTLSEELKLIVIE